MKQVLIDISMIMVGTRFTGIPRVVMEVSKQLSQKKEIELVFLEFNQKKDCFEIIDTASFLLFCKNRREDRKHMRTGKFLKYDAICMGLNVIKKQDQSPKQKYAQVQNNDIIFLDLDTVWKTRVRRSYLYPKLKKQNIRIISHVYDIIPITHPQFCILDDVLCFIDYLGAALQYADEMIVNSHATRHAVEKMCFETGITLKLPEIHVIPLGGNFSKENTIRDANVRPQIRQIEANRKYLLAVGTIEPRKNHKILLDAYENGLKDAGFSIVIVGFPGWNVDELMVRIKRHPDYQKGIFLPENVNDDELQYLYKHCFALAFPSLIEGYGLPIMEALVKGVLVVASDTEINTETGKEYALYYKKDSVDDLVHIVTKLAKDNELLSRIKAGMSDFVPPTWEECGEYFYKLLCR